MWFGWRFLYFPYISAAEFIMLVWLYTEIVLKYQLIFRPGNQFRNITQTYFKDFISDNHYSVKPTSILNSRQKTAAKLSALLTHLTAFIERETPSTIILAWCCIFTSNQPRKVWKIIGNTSGFISNLNRKDHWRHGVSCPCKAMVSVVHVKVSAVWMSLLSTPPHKKTRKLKHHG